MNCWLGRDNPFIGMGDKIKLTSEEMQLETTEALNQMQLPNRTLLWRGSKKELVRGLEDLEGKPIGKWKGESVFMQGFASTSILRSTAYLDSDVVLAIVAPEDIPGAGLPDRPPSLRHRPASRPLKPSRPSRPPGWRR